MPEIQISFSVYFVGVLVLPMLIFIIYLVHIIMQNAFYEQKMKKPIGYSLVDKIVWDGYDFKLFILFMIFSWVIRFCNFDISHLPLYIQWQTQYCWDSTPWWHNWRILSSRGIPAYLPTSISNDVIKFAGALSHFAAHMIDVCPYKMA